MKLRIETEKSLIFSPFDWPIHTCKVYAPVGPYGRYIEVAVAQSTLSPVFAKDMAIAQACSAVVAIKAHQEKTVEYINI